MKKLAMAAAGMCLLCAFAAQAKTGTMFFFDAEDYTNPRSWDALRELSTLFHEKGATGADKVTVTPPDPLAELRNQVELRAFHAVGTWVFMPDYKDIYTTDRLRWQVWTLRREF